MSKSCPNCGFENPDNVAKCQVCGNDLPVFENVNPSSGGGNMKNLILHGLKEINLAMIFIILSFVVSVVILSAIAGRFEISGFFLFGGITDTSINTSSVSTILEYSSIILIVSSIITLVSVYLMRSGFSSLSSVNMRFGTGRTGTTLWFIGYIMVVVGYIAILEVFYTAAAGNSPGAVGYAILAAIFLLIGGLMALIGVIMACIGLFRIGSIFNQDTSKIGAILLFLISFVGAILLFFGTRSIIRKVEGGGSQGPPGTINSPPTV